MSGGSYNYLYCHVSGLEAQLRDVERMAGRLEAGGYYAAARETRSVLYLLEMAERAAQNLAGVWQAVEWADSGDSSEERVREAAAGFEPLIVKAEQ